MLLFEREPSTVQVSRWKLIHPERVRQSRTKLTSVMLYSKSFQKVVNALVNYGGAVKSYDRSIVDPSVSEMQVERLEKQERAAFEQVLKAASLYSKGNKNK